MKPWLRVSLVHEGGGTAEADFRTQEQSRDSRGQLHRLSFAYTRRVETAGAGGRVRHGDGAQRSFPEPDADLQAALGKYLSRIETSGVRSKPPDTELPGRSRRRG